jgi:hypothetical protein
VPLGRFELLAVTNSGASLVLGVEHEAGPVPDPLPPRDLLLYGADLGLRATFSLNQSGLIRTLPLDDDRLIVEVRDKDQEGVLWRAAGRRRQGRQLRGRRRQLGHR